MNEPWEFVWSGERRYELSQYLAVLDQDSAERLTSALDRIAPGVSKDWRSPLYKGHDGTSRAEIVEACEQAIGEPTDEEQAFFDEKGKDKCGPFSLIKAWPDRIEDLDTHWHQEWNPDEAALNQAVDEERACVPLRSIRPTSPHTAFSAMVKGTNLGGPRHTSDKSWLGEYLTRAIALERPEQLAPAQVWSRGQPSSKTETKTRNVWGPDHAAIIRGLTMLNPMLSTLKHLPGNAAWVGDWKVDESLTTLLDMADGRPVLSCDFDNFDACVPVELLLLVDDIHGSWSTPEGEATIRLIGDAANRMPIVVPGEVWGGKVGGIPSGDVFTNMRGSRVNRLACRYVGIRASSPVVAGEWLGDDSVCLYRDGMDAEAFSRYVGELGLKANTSKQYISTTSAHYLQRLHSVNLRKDGLCRGIRSPYRALSGMMSYEIFRDPKRWSGYMDSARWIMQMENVRHDPRFVDFVRFIRDGDAILRSGVDPAVIFRRAGGADEIRSVLNIASFPFNVQNPEKLNDFDTTRVLRSLT